MKIVLIWTIFLKQRMKSVPNDIDPLTEEHWTLMRQYGRAQSRCSDLVGTQAAELVELRAQVLCLRAAVIVRETTLAWEREDRMALEMRIPGLPRRMALARRVDHLVERVQDLLRERLHRQWRRPTMSPLQSTLPDTGPAAPTACIVMTTDGIEPLEDTAAFEASLVAADLVICQTGCLSHDAYWRVQDHCRRTGKACVVVAQPDVVRIVRIHKTAAHDIPAVGDPVSDAVSSIEVSAIGN